MFPHPSDNLAVPHDSNPPGNDVLATLRGFLDVHSSAVSLVGRGHINIATSGSEVADFGFPLLYHAIELVDAVAGLLKVLGGNRHLSAYSSDEAIGDSTCSVLEVTTLIHAEDSFGCAR